MNCFRIVLGCLVLFLSGVLQAIAAAKPIQCEPMGPADGPVTLVILHGSSGPDAYRGRAKFYADHGYTVLFPHFFDAAIGSGRTDRDYAAWVDAVRGCIAQASPDKPIVLFGMSLGASVALAAGTQMPNIDAVIDWSGSLPDTYFLYIQRLPPLLILHGDRDTNVPVMNARQLFTLCERTHTVCTGTIYPGEGHMFPGQADDATSRALKFLQSRSAAARPIP